MTKEKSYARVEMPETDPGNAAPTFASTLWDTTSQISDSPTRERRLSHTWLYEMHPKVDMEYFSSLSQLSLLVKRSQSSSCQINDYGTLLQSYKQQRADIVGQACLRYSDGLLQQGPETVGSWISEES
jgi:hypothetical protein